MEGKPTPADEARRLYEEAEGRTARATRSSIARDSFGELLAKVTENALAVVKMGSDAADLVVRNLRVAGRRDITGLARQLARTEDKLEMVLQEIERLQEELREARETAGRNGGGGAGASTSRGGGSRSKTEQ